MHVSNARCVYWCLCVQVGRDSSMRCENGSRPDAASAAIRNDMHAELLATTIFVIATCYRSSPRWLGRAGESVLRGHLILSW